MRSHYRCWAAIGAGLVLAGCGGAAASTTNRSAPNATAMPPNGAGRCTEVYCVPETVPRGPTNRSAPNATALPPINSQRCTQVYCVPQAVPRRPAALAITG